jgi:hypothetical protein
VTPTAIVAALRAAGIQLATGGDAVELHLPGGAGLTDAGAAALRDLLRPLKAGLAGVGRESPSGPNAPNGARNGAGFGAKSVSGAVSASTGPLTARARPRIWTAPELMAHDFAEPSWAVRGLLPGGLAVLAGRPKRGKSWMALGLAVAVARGTPAFGHFPTGPARPVLYMALEDPDRRVQARLRALLGADGPYPPHLHVVTAWPRLGEGFEEDLRAWLDAHRDAALVIVDTFARVRPPLPRGGDPYAHDYAAACYLKAVADAHDASALALHHTRKPTAGVGDPFDEVLGSTGLTAAMDTGLVLEAEVGKADARLYCRGRDLDEATHALALDPDRGAWRRLGDAGEVRRSPERQAILAALADAPGGLTPKEIAQATGQKDTNVRFLLHRMRDAAEAVEHARRYYLPGRQPTAVSGGPDLLTAPLTRQVPETSVTPTDVSGVSAVSDPPSGPPSPRPADPPAARTVPCRACGRPRREGETCPVCHPPPPATGAAPTAAREEART